MVGHVEDFFDLPKIFIIGTLFCIFRGSIDSRVSHNTHFFELSYALLISHAIGLEEATKKISAL